MKLCLTLLCCLLFFCPVSPAVSAQNIDKVLVAKARSDFDIDHLYYTSLLKKALIKAANGRKVPDIQTTFVMEQGRALRELDRGQWLDVFWLGTDRVKEQDFHAIRIPLERGLLGFRKFILHKDSVEQFNSVRSLEQLKQLKACQGAFWPDVDIMRAAGLKVDESPVYENIFKQMVAKRCDYFPRGLYEGAIELEKRHALYPELVRYDHLMLYYPFAVYFFTGKHNKALASWIEQGLELMIDDGELLEHMQQHELTRHVFPLQHTKKEQWISIENPLLSTDTVTTNSRYWFQPKDFKLTGN